ncbi:hypothetical protein [Acinetobacter baumannii]|uniref:hypothetical protein n=1 Tax=Acinetobacter baumannii TaxID=470 RepID=UPI003AF8E3C3
MTDLNKEREAFEGKFPKPHWIEWDEKLGQYISNQVSDVCYQARFEAWLEAKAQAVPEGFCVVPKEIPDNVVSCLENSGYHWGDMTRDHYAPIYSLMVEVASESGVIE